MDTDISDITPIPGHQYGTGPEHNLKLFYIILAWSIVSTVFVAMRVYSRFMIARKWGIDDTLMIAAWLTSVADTVVRFIYAYDTETRHIWDISPHQIKTAFKTILAAQIFLATSLGFVKCSILMLYTRLFSDKTLHLISYLTIVFVALNTIAYDVAILLQCKPIAALWDFTINPSAHCINIAALHYTMCGIDLATDIWVFCLPLKTIFGLSVKLTKKLQIASLFLLGFIACIASGFKIYCLRGWINSRDLTWDSVSIMIWVSTEVNMAIITACLPIALPGFKKLFWESWHSDVIEVTGSRESRGSLPPHKRNASATTANEPEQKLISSLSSAPTMRTSRTAQTRPEIYYRKDEEGGLEDGSNSNESDTIELF